MSIELECGCGRTMLAEDAQVGSLLRCPKCGRENEVQAAGEPIWPWIVGGAGALLLILAMGLILSAFWAFERMQPKMMPSRAVPGVRQPPIGPGGGISIPTTRPSPFENLTSPDDE